VTDDRWLWTRSVPTDQRFICRCWTSNRSERPHDRSRTPTVRR